MADTLDGKLADILNKKAKVARDELTDLESAEEIESLIQMEKKGKNREGIIQEASRHLLELKKEIAPPKKGASGAESKPNKAPPKKGGYETCSTPGCTQKVVSKSGDKKMCYNCFKKKDGPKKKARKRRAPGGPKTCPVCGVKATTEEQIEKIFGFRKMKGSTRKQPQSYCRQCRSDKSKKAKNKKAKKPAA